MNSNWSRRDVVKAVGSTGILLGAGVGSAAARPPSEGDTIVDVASEQGFGTLVAAVQAAGLVDTLSGNRQLTVFAPTNGAFEALGVTEENVGDVDFEEAVGVSLLDILTYHVTPGRRDAESVTTSDELPTLNGEKIAVDVTVLNGGQATISATDIMASNGIIHAIDGVLLP